MKCLISGKLRPWSEGYTDELTKMNKWMWNLRVKYSSIFETHRVKQNKTDFFIAGLSLRVFNSSVSVHSEFQGKCSVFQDYLKKGIPFGWPSGNSGLQNLVWEAVHSAKSNLAPLLWITWENSNVNNYSLWVKYCGKCFRCINSSSQHTYEVGSIIITL